MDYFIRHPSRSRVPCVGTPEPAWGTNEPCLKLYETVGPLLHGLCAPFLELKVELTKLQAANSSTLMGLLSLAITNLWKVDLRFQYLKMNRNEMLFQRSILKIEQYYNKVCFHTSEENKSLMYIQWMLTGNFLMPNLFWLNLMWQEGDRGPHK